MRLIKWYPCLCGISRVRISLWSNSIA